MPSSRPTTPATDPTAAPEPLPPQVTEAPTRWVVLTRRGCHLCDEALALLSSRLDAGDLTVLDVDDDPDLRRRFTDHVPVVVADGHLLAYWTLPSVLVDDVLAGRPTPAPPAL